MKSYSFSADLVRTLAIIGAVGIHVIIPITARPDFFGGSIWWITFLLNCLFRISVPLFILLSGYLTLGKPTTPQQNWSKLQTRLFVPLLAYYAISCTAYAWIAHLRAEPYDYAGIFHNLSKNTHSSLYFLVILLGIQLLNPVWNVLTEAKNRPILNYTINFFLILGAAAYIFYYLSLREGEVFSTFTYWIMWLGYYLYGYRVKTQTAQLTQTETRRYLLLAVSSFVFVVTFGYFNLWLYHRQISDLFYIGGQTYADAYLSVPVIVMALSVFQLLMRSSVVQRLAETQPLKKFVIFMASISLGLYLNHLLVLDTFSKLYGVTPDSPSMNGLAGFLVVSVLVTFGITIPLVWVMKKTPLLRAIIGEK